MNKIIFYFLAVLSVKSRKSRKNLQRKYIDLVKITLHNDSTTNANTNFCSKFRMLIKMKVVREKK